MPTRSLVQSCLKHVDLRWHLLKWLHENASDHYVAFDAIFQQYPQSMKWSDLLNELAMLCHHRQIYFKESNKKTRYMFHSFKSEPIMPLNTQPDMTVDDYICAIQPSYTNTTMTQDDMTDSMLIDPCSGDEDEVHMPNLSRYAHPFCVDHRPSGELVWLRFL